MVLNFVQKYGKMLVLLLVVLVVVLLGIGNVGKMQFYGHHCKIPQDYSAEVSKSYVKAMNEVSKLLPIDDNYVTDEKDPRVDKIKKNIEKITVKTSNKMKRCAAGYHKMNKSDKRLARNQMYSKVKGYNNSEDGQNFQKAIVMNTAISVELSRMKSITRYAFVKPKSETVRK